MGAARDGAGPKVCTLAELTGVTGVAGIAGIAGIAGVAVVAGVAGVAGVVRRPDFRGPISVSVRASIACPDSGAQRSGRRTGWMVRNHLGRKSWPCSST